MRDQFHLPSRLTNGGWLYCFLAASGLLLLWRFPRWTVDDAFISARYAANLLAHGALVWNVGEAAVDGYTGFAWPLLLAAGMALGATPEAVGHLLGSLAFLLIPILLWQWSRTLQLPPSASLLLLLLFVGASGSYVHALSGLETLPFGAAVVAALLALTRTLHRAAPESPALWLTLLVASLLRPEGVALALAVLFSIALQASPAQASAPPDRLALAVLFSIALQRRHHDSARWGWLRMALLLYVAPALLYYGWRTLYYGDWLPNTFYVKSFSGGINPRSVRSLLVVVRDHALLPSLALAAFAALAGTSGRQRAARRWRRDWPLWLSIVLFTLAVTASNLRAMLWMNYADRLWFPLFLPVWMALLAFASALWPAAAGRRHRLALGVAMLACLGQVAFMARAWPTDLHYVQRYHDAIESAARPAALHLQRLLPPNERVAVIDAGIIPYLSMRPALDLGGLNDRALAHNFSVDGAVERFFADQPGAFVIVVPPRQLADSPSIPGRIVRDPRFSRYRLVEAIPAAGAARGNTAMIYLREDLAE